MLLHEIVSFSASVVPDDLALVADGRRWTYADLDADIARLAARIAGLVDPGERVAVIADNRARYVMALYAVPRAGAILVHGNTRHTAAELVDLLAASGASAVLATADHLARIAATSRRASRRPPLDGPRPDRRLGR